MKKTQLQVKQVYKAFEEHLSSWNLKKVISWLCLLAIIVGSSGLYLWYGRMYVNDERRFWMALENSMATPSVTRSLKNGGSGNRVIQKQQFLFAPQAATRSHVSYTQKTATVDTAVETEGIRFINAQYSRYITFRTNQKRPNGTVPSLEKILGKWESDKASLADTEGAKQNYVGELVTLAIFGNFSADFRREAIDAFIRNNTYKILKEDTKDEEIDGRKVKLITTEINLKSYAEQLQRAFARLGLGDFPPLNPDNYRPDSKIRGIFTIDSRNNSIIRIKFGTREEHYSGYGLLQTAETPHADFEGGQLEAIVQEEIKGAL